MTDAGGGWQDGVAGGVVGDGSDGESDSVEVPVERASALWPGDAGDLAERSRRALLELVRGPYLSRERSPQNWAALLADAPAITRRLHELFLDLVIDTDGEFAFVRSVATADNGFPVAVRSQPLTFLDSAMLLALRQRLISEEVARVIVGQDELYEELQVLRTADRDAADFTKRLNASWSTMVNKLRVLHPIKGSAAGDDATRAEISPVVRMLVDADRVRELRAAFDRVAAGGPAIAEDDGGGVDSSERSGEDDE